MFLHLMVKLMVTSQLGLKKVILPWYFTGGLRFQHQLYQDARGILWCFGKPDFFITFIVCVPRVGPTPSLVPSKIFCHISLHKNNL